MKILFKVNGKPIDSRVITTCISRFGNSYNETVREIIVKSDKGLDCETFRQNVARLMPNFKMTRQGPFKGVSYSSGVVKDPKRKIAACWEAIGDNALKLRHFLDEERAEIETKLLKAKIFSGSPGQP